jgi:hypothetical protein
MSKAVEVKLDQKCRARLAKFGRPGDRYLAESPRPGEILLQKLRVQESKAVKARIVRIGSRRYLTHNGTVSDDDTQKIMAEFPSIPLGCLQPRCLAIEQPCGSSKDGILGSRKNPHSLPDHGIGLFARQYQAGVWCYYETGSSNLKDWLHDENPELVPADLRALEGEPAPSSSKNTD